MSLIETLWAHRKEILPGATEDEIQHAFAEVLADPPGVGGYLEALREAGRQYRSTRAHILANEMAWDALMIREHMDRWLDVEGDDELHPFPAHSLTDEELARIVNDTLEELGYDAAQAFILLELRGCPMEEVSGILWLAPSKIESLVAGVKGRLRARLSR